MEGDQMTLSASVVLTVAEEVFIANGFRVTRNVSGSSLPIDRTLLAEDEYSVVAVLTFDTWTQLMREWADAQAELTGLMAKGLAKSTPKAWDGYLVLMCLASAPSASEVAGIERDTTRLRKIIATADAIRTTSDVMRILDPFLPIPIPDLATVDSDVLSTLPELLASEVPKKAVEVVIKAFREMQPPLERLNDIAGSTSDEA
jgi:hypothetical protein